MSMGLGKCIVNFEGGWIDIINLCGSSFVWSQS
jgi:hypothetical protein